MADQFTLIADSISGLSANATPEIYSNATPASTTASFSPLQLALLAAMTTGDPPAFGINQDYLKELKKFSDSGIVDAGVIYTDVVGLLTALGDDIYLLRDAQNCGPDGLDRTEEVFLCKRADLPIAFGTFAHYGRKIFGGTAGGGTSIDSGGNDFVGFAAAPSDVNNWAGADYGTGLGGAASGDYSGTGTDTGTC